MSLSPNVQKFDGGITRGGDVAEADSRRLEYRDQGRKSRYLVRGLAGAALALGLLTAACGEGPAAIAVEAVPPTAEASAIDRQATLNQVLAELVGVNGPYSGPVTEPTGMPGWLIGVNGPYSDQPSAVPGNVQ